VRVVFAEDVERDIDAITAYSYERWGEAQAVLYVCALREACMTELAQYLSLARPVVERPHLLQWRHRSHIIYFKRLDARTLEVLRILHESMSPQRHL